MLPAKRFHDNIHPMHLSTVAMALTWAFQNDHVAADVQNRFLAFLIEAAGHNDPEVRLAAYGELQRFVPFFRIPSLPDRILPIFLKGLQDPELRVQESFKQIMMRSTPTIGSLVSDFELIDPSDIQARMTALHRLSLNREMEHVVPADVVMTPLFKGLQDTDRRMTLGNKTLPLFLKSPATRSSVS